MIRKLLKDWFTMGGGTQALAFVCAFLAALLMILCHYAILDHAESWRGECSVLRYEVEDYEVTPILRCNEEEYKWKRGAEALDAHLNRGAPLICSVYESGNARCLEEEK
jgi:hypothetical protein